MGEMDGRTTPIISYSIVECVLWVVIVCDLSRREKVQFSGKVRDRRDLRAAAGGGLALYIIPTCLPQDSHNIHYTTPEWPLD
jgi:hypothetical protein